MKLLLNLLIFFLFLLSACKKQVKTHYITDPILREAASFKEGSYWVYKDSVNADIDSFYVSAVGGGFPLNHGQTEEYEYLFYIQTAKNSNIGFSIEAYAKIEMGIHYGNMPNEHKLYLHIGLNGVSYSKYGICLIDNSASIGIVNWVKEGNLDTIGNYTFLKMNDTYSLSDKNYSDVYVVSGYQKISKELNTVFEMYYSVNFGLIKYKLSIDSLKFNSSVLRTDVIK